MSSAHREEVWTLDDSTGGRPAEPETHRPAAEHGAPADRRDGRRRSAGRATARARCGHWGVADRMALFDHLLVPVADDDDATTTANALVPHLGDVERVTVVHVVEKGGGVVDKAPLEKRRADGRQFLATLESALATAAPTVPVETHVTFGTDVADTIVETAADVGATAVAFRPRGGSRLARLLSGDTATRLVSDPEVTVVALGTPGRPDGTPDADTEADRREVT